jgi:nitrite reductase/ring-hydroxylating ferredoxin subunit
LAIVVLQLWFIYLFTCISLGIFIIPAPSTNHLLFTLIIFTFIKKFDHSESFAFTVKKPFFSDDKTIGEKQKICAKNDIPVGGTKSFVLKNDSVPYILIHTEEGEFYAYEQKCTHLSCAVYYKPGTLKIECPCHNGWFDVKTGEVLQGPPPRPLKKLVVTLQGDDIFVQHPKTENV